ncbi:MAG: septal ring lytic transglycosylase RlpA family protein [Porphyrobacter sp.]|nr:septal ring lytic transglycosylase RlpA family protein [Porphyrobacter sp.]
MSVTTFGLLRPKRPARQALLALCAACLPLSGLSASAGADGSVAEGVVANTAVAGIASAVQPSLSDLPLTEVPDLRVIAGGTASYYAGKFEGRPTANGERYRAAELTAAHRSLPFGSKVRVTNPATGKSVIVRINDRGPFTPGRVIDVSRSAAEELGLIARGHAPVELAVIEG